MPGVEEKQVLIMSHSNVKMLQRRQEIRMFSLMKISSNINGPDAQWVNEPHVSNQKRYCYKTVNSEANEQQQKITTSKLTTFHLFS